MRYDDGDAKIHLRNVRPVPVIVGAVKLDASDPYYDADRSKQFSTATPKVVFSSFALAVVVFNVPFAAQILAKINPLFNGFFERRMLWI